MVRLKRIYQNDKQTLGIMTLYDKYDFPFYEVRTLELSDKQNQRRISCIPCGEYEVVKRYSEKYKDHFHILNVSNRDYILIHNANFYWQLKGCIAVGMSHTDIDGDDLRDVTSSKSTLRKLNKHLPDSFKLIIEDGHMA